MSVMRSMSTRIGIAALLAAIATLLFTAPNAGADTIVGKEGPSAQYSGCEDHAIDPVGVLFRGLRAGVSNVSRSIIFETGDDDDGWHYTENYAPQGLKIHQPDGSYDCKYTDGANASASGKWANSRTHVRLWFVDGSADENPAPNEVKTVGTPHHEDFVVSVDPQIPGIDLGALGFGTNLGCKGLPVSLDLPTPFGWISVNGNHAVDEGGHINQNKDSGFDRGRHELRQAFENKHEIKAEDWGNTEEIHQCDDDYAGSDGNGVTIYIKRAMYPKTAQASNIYTNTSTLNGFLDTDEPTTSYWFAYGTNPSQGAGGYPNETSATMIAGSASIDVSKAISGLTPNTTYYVRLFAENQDGEVEEGNEVSFSTCYTGSFNSDEEASGPRPIVDCDKIVHVFYRTPKGGLGHRWMAPTDTSWGSDTLGGSVAGEPEAVVDKDGGINVFYRTPKGTLGHDWWEAGGTKWGSEDLGGAVATDPHAIVDKDKVVHVFYRTPNNGIGHRWMAPTDTSWGSDSLGGPIAGEPIAVVDRDGGINVFFRKFGGTLGHDWWEVGGTKWGSEDLGGAVGSGCAGSSQTDTRIGPRPRAVVDCDKTVHVFYRTPSGTLGHRWMAPTDTSWNSNTLGGALAGEPEAEVDKDGGINVFFRTTTGTLGHDWLEAGSNTWGTENLGGSVAADPHAIVDKDKVVHVFYRTPSGTLGHRWMAPTDTSWGSDTLGGSVAGEPEAEVDKDGGINVFFRTTTGTLGHDWWEVGGNTWGTENLGGSVAADPHAIVDKDKVVHVFYRTPSGTLGHRWMAPTDTSWGSDTLGGALAGEPEAEVDKDGGINVFFRTTTGTLGHDWWEVGGANSGKWGTENLGGSVAGPLPRYRYVLGTSAGSSFTWGATSLITMAQPQAMAIKDVTGDGKADVVSAEVEGSGSTYRYMLGSSATSYFGWSGTSLVGMTQPAMMALGDVTGDGKADIVATEKQASGQYNYKLGISSSSNFTWYSTNLNGMSEPTQLALGDVTGDGKADIVATEKQPDGYYRYMLGVSGGSTTFTWGFTSLSGMSQPQKLALGDINNDGKGDIVAVENEAGGKARYIYATSSGSNFNSPKVSNLIGMTPPTKIAVGDVNKDGRADIVGAEPEGNGRYRYMLGSSSGSSFAWTATSMVSMGEPFRMSVADVTGDGKADVVGVEPQYAG